jgi:DNA-binding response OmpR family regulator
MIRARDSVHGFEYSELHNRCISRLGERALAVRNSCVYRNQVPVQNRIGLCSRSPNSRVAINMHTLKVLFVASPCIRFIVLPPDSSLTSMGCAMASEPARVEQPIRFGEDYEVDLRPRRLRRGIHVLKLERIPFEILLLLLEHRDEIVTRDQIVSRVWGQSAFLDTDNSIRDAIRKLVTSPKAAFS